jgi:glycosidase
MENLVMNLRGLFILWFLFSILVSCQISNKDQIREYIPKISLKAGLTDSLDIRDLFFSKKYDLEFINHPSIKIEYDMENHLLKLTPDSSSEDLTLIEFKFAGKRYAFPVNIRMLQKFHFQYRPEKSPQRLNLFGSFNSWNRENIPLTDQDGDGIYDAILSLEPGRYEYKYFVDGEEIIDSSNPDSVANPFGAFNSVLTVYPRHSDSDFLHILGYEEKNDGIILSLYYEGENADFPLQKSEVVALLNNIKCSEELIELSGNQIRLTLKKEELTKESLVRVLVSKAGNSTRFQSVNLYNAHPRGLRGTEFSWYDAIIYSIMIDRFSDGDPTNSKPVEHPELDNRANFYGGDLQGIINKMQEGYFDKLGVNVLWLFPVNQNPLDAFQEYPEPHKYFTGYHGYWPIHPEKVDFRFGNINLFKELVKMAHAGGMKVLLDFVANHVHQEHPFYVEHPKWFGTLDLPDGRQNIRMWDEYRLTTWFDTFLPSFDYLGSSKALEVMTDNAIWWMKETGIDGFRQDAVKHIPNKFWRSLTRKIKEQVEEKENRRTFQIGETFGSYELISTYVNNGQLNAQFNFNLYDVALQVFLNPEASFQVLEIEMRKTFDTYGQNHLMGNLMDSHDKARFMAYADGDISSTSENVDELAWSSPPQVDNPESYKKALLYMAYMLTIPGTPVIYYGDEIGMTGATDPDNRRPMRFEEELNDHEKQMLKNIKKVIHLRKNHSALRYGDFLTLMAKDDIYAFVRSDLNERLLIVLNKDLQQANVALRIPTIYGSKTALDLLTQETFQIKGDQIKIAVKAEDFKIFQLHN